MAKKCLPPNPGDASGDARRNPGQDAHDPSALVLHGLRRHQEARTRGRRETMDHQSLPRTRPAGPSPGLPRRRPSYSEEFEAARRQAIQGRRRRMDSLNLETSSSMLLGDGFSTFLEGWTPSPIFYPPAIAAETVSEGQELYLHFFHECLRNEGLGELAAQQEAGLDCYHDSSTHVGDGDEAEGTYAAAARRRTRRQSMNLQNFNNPNWRHTGRVLKVLADRFARSEERQAVRIRAEQVNVRSLDAQQFALMLKELFMDGDITRERILVLFFFCSDVAIRAVRCKLEGMLSQLTSWTLSFIKEQVCDWVQCNGGWQKVFCSGLNVMQHIAFLGMCAAVMTACFFYVRKNLN